MTLPLVIPSGSGSTLPPTALSPSSTDESSSGPRTPVSPTPHATTTGKSLKKSSRRANTAERRATHNAVERARRETLNGRFLDLAKMLPNLSQIRRPSKSAIVNSSIAHIHASRRHRVLASRELRMIKLEADQLRHELNEWRDRAGISRVEEPVRGDGFSMVLNQELEVIPIMTSGGDEDEDGLYGDEDEESGGAIGVEEQQRMMMAAGPTATMGGYPVYSHQQQPPQQQQPQPQQPQPQQQQRPPFSHHPQSLPMIATPGSFDGYTDYHHHHNLPYDKFPIQQQQPPPQYHHQQQRRDRSNSMASMTSSGSASPPLPLYPQPFEAGWSTHPQSGGGIGNGVTFAMM
ncbi:hypothetical protein AAF712_014107 [Marasmius tenuissimus]|uniref:BHLH domain-containing protein n=1 Tax=Marasmius tenuissimus TaxID=585030 RepID=A0ABR2ZCY8_9AGAR